MLKLGTAPVWVTAPPASGWVLPAHLRRLLRPHHERLLALAQREPRLSAARLPYVLLAGVDHRHLAGGARLGLERRPGGDLLDRALRGLVLALAAAQHHVRAGGAVDVEPVVLGARELVGEVVVPLVAAPDQHFPALGGGDPARLEAAGRRRLRGAPRGIRARRDPGSAEAPAQGGRERLERGEH